MKSVFAFIAAGITGIISGWGVGGGTLLVVYLTAFAKAEQGFARGVNLMYFLPTSASALYSHIKNGYIRWKCAIPAAIAGTATAAMGAYLASLMSGGGLRKLFGVFLLIVGIKELLYKETKTKAEN